MGCEHVSSQTKHPSEIRPALHSSANAVNTKMNTCDTVIDTCLALVITDWLLQQYELESLRRTYLTALSANSSMVSWDDTSLTNGADPIFQPPNDSNTLTMKQLGQ